jgi:hypothetical protein
MYGYKVVKKTHGHFISVWAGTVKAARRYEVGKLTTRRKHYGPLAVFCGLSDAEYFRCAHDPYRELGVKIYLCRYTKAYRTQDTLFTPHERLPPSRQPEGTKLAHSLTLLREVNAKDWARSRKNDEGRLKR